MNTPANTCRICGNSLNNRVYTISEMHIGLFEKFEYFQCSACDCIQIAQIPEDMAKYYPQDYYSFSAPKQVKNKILAWLTIQTKKSLVRYYAGDFNPVGFSFSLFYKNPFPWLSKSLAGFDSRILDVGSGTGRLLLSMHRSGFTNLTGLDPYISETIDYGNNVRIYNKDISEMKGEYDLIMFHHSFEHMSSPVEILKKTYELLTPEGHVLIRIPVAGGLAWRKYREKWVQLDAPRHFFIHSVKSMEILCGKTGFGIDRLVYDSSYLQFSGSEKYLRGIPLSSETEPFSKRQIKKFKKEAIRLNRKKDGDAACFYLKKSVGA